MTTAYGYATRNQMTKIEQNEGANVPDGFAHAWKENGNFTRTTYRNDGAYWNYWYNDRHRPADAERNVRRGERAAPCSSDSPARILRTQPSIRETVIGSPSRIPANTRGFPSNFPTMLTAVTSRHSFPFETGVGPNGSAMHPPCTQ